MIDKLSNGYNARHRNSFNTSLKMASCQHSNVHVKSTQIKQLNELFYTCTHTAKLLACFKVCKLHIQTIIIIIQDYNVCHMLDIILFFTNLKLIIIPNVSAAIQLPLSNKRIMSNIT